MDRVDDKMTGRFALKSFPITEANYRAAINVCIGVAIVASIAPQFMQVKNWLIWVILVASAGIALALRFSCDLSKGSDGQGYEPDAERDLLPVIVPFHPPVTMSSKASSLRPVAYLVHQSYSDREIAHYLLNHLLTSRAIHHKIPQTERIKQQLLDEFAGHENPWMVDVPIGSINLRIRGNFVDIHVLPVRKQGIRDPHAPRASVSRVVQ